MLTPQFINGMKEKLLQAKKKLENDLAGLRPHTELGEDVDSSVQEVEEDEVNQDLIARMEQDLQKIGKALGKIEQGTYGIDDEGKPIAEKRLEALPWADKAL